MLIFSMALDPFDGERLGPTAKQSFVVGRPKIAIMDQGLWFTEGTSQRKWGGEVGELIAISMSTLCMIADVGRLVCDGLIIRCQI